MSARAHGDRTAQRVCEETAARLGQEPLGETASPSESLPRTFSPLLTSPHDVPKTQFPLPRPLLSVGAGDEVITNKLHT